MGEGHRKKSQVQTGWGVGPGNSTSGPTGPLVAFGMQSLFIATGNAHKVEEIRSFLGSGFRVVSQKEVDLRLDPEETGSSFAENAAIKAITWARHLASGAQVQGVDWVLADDSGRAARGHPARR